MNILCIEEWGVGREAEGVKQMSESCYLFCPMKELDAEEDGLVPNKE